jgi:hypothetical protein
VTKKRITLNGSVAVVWYISHDTVPEALKTVLDINIERGIFDSFSIEVHVSGKDMWVLDVNNGVHLTHFRSDGSEVPITVPGEDLTEAFTPPNDTPADVWRRAIIEAHELVCRDPKEYCCREISKKLPALP